MRLSKSIIYLLILSFIFVQISPAFAGIVGTDSYLSEQTIQQDREDLRALMSRDEVRLLLETNGLTMEQAQARVDSLTDKEVSQMAKKFDELPAAGDAAVVVLVIALVVLVLELAGITDIFTGI
ncbi:MAG: PA2779 family protein [Gammaproteobacteria bacterium]|nr:MAG: PA2779 family protein [Gammaproteobacteria bacterium]